MPPTSEQDLGFEVKKAFVQQFAENNKHNQTLFIQFLSVVIVALIAYAYVYTNTSTYSNSQNKSSQTTRTFQSADTSLLEPFEADTYGSTKSPDGNILSYSKIHLLGSYMFAQLVLVILGITLLHLGYSYRRDQQVVYNIRLQSLGERQFKDIFPIGYIGLGKRFTNYLPNFYAILFYALFLIQLIVYWSVIEYLARFDEYRMEGLEKVEVVFLENFVFGYDATYRNIKFVLLIPVGLICIAYCIYFLKYNRNVNNIRLINRLEITQISDRENLAKIARLYFWFLTVKLILMFVLGIFSLALAASALLSLTGLSSTLFARYLKKKKSGGPSSDAHSLFYGLAGGIIIATTIFFIVTRMFKMNKDPLLLFVLCLALAITSYTIGYIKQNLQSADRSTTHHLYKFESYHLLIIAICMGTIYYSNIFFFDLILSFLLGLHALAYCIRGFVYKVDNEFERTYGEGTKFV